MTARELTKADVRSFYRGSPELTKAILEAMDNDWRRVIDGGYPRLVCPHATGENPIKPVRLPKTSGKGDSSAAKKVRGRVAKCPDRHDLLG